MWAYISSMSTGLYRHIVLIKLYRRQSKGSRLSSLMVSAHGSGKCLQCRRVSTVMVCYTALIHTHVHIHDGKSNHEFMHHAYEVPKTLANPRWYGRCLRLRGRVIIANLTDLFACGTWVQGKLLPTINSTVGTRRLSHRRSQLSYSTTFNILIDLHEEFHNILIRLSDDSS